MRNAASPARGEEPALSELLARVRSAPIVIADGAIGSTLIAHYGADPECPEALSLTHPERVEALARAYREAGAEILQTNTFGASPFALAAGEWRGRTAEMNAAAVAAARRALAGVPDYDPEAIAATVERYSLAAWQEAMARIWDEVAPTHA